MEDKISDIPKQENVKVTEDLTSKKEEPLNRPVNLDITEQIEEIKTLLTSDLQAEQCRIVLSTEQWGNLNKTPLGEIISAKLSLKPYKGIYFEELSDQKVALTFFDKSQELLDYLEIKPDISDKKKYKSKIKVKKSIDQPVKDIYDLSTELTPAKKLQKILADNPEIDKQYEVILKHLEKKARQFKKFNRDSIIPLGPESQDDTLYKDKRVENRQKIFFLGKVFS